MDVSKAIKHFCDRLAGLVLLVSSTPLLLLWCVALRLESRGNPMFLQERIGARGRAFSMFRFRVMRSVQGESRQVGDPDREPAGGVRQLPDGARERTKMGRLLRSTRSEWLPQLINIALGEMSFVGPRAARRGETDAYTPRHARRLMFRPGLTGWAQIHARQAGRSQQRCLDLDLSYCERFSWGLDLRILWHAVWRTQPAAAGEDRRQTVPHSAGLRAATGDGTEALATTHAADHAAAGAATAPAAPEQPAHPHALVPLIVIGNGGHARVVLDAIERQGLFAVVGLLADAIPQGQQSFGYPILGDAAVLEHAATPRLAVVALGSGRAREAWFSALAQHDYEIAPVVHPDAHVGRDVEIGAGTVVLAGAVVNPGVKLGRGVLVRSGTTLDHGCQLDDFSHVAPGAHLASDVRVGARSHVGIGACVVPGIQLGSDVLVGAGAVVTQSVPRGYTVVGTPGRTMRRPDLPVGRAAGRDASRVS